MELGMISISYKKYVGNMKNMKKYVKNIKECGENMKEYVESMEI